MMRFLNGKVCKMMMSHFRTLHVYCCSFCLKFIIGVFKMSIDAFSLLRTLWMYILQYLHSYCNNIPGCQLTGKVFYKVDDKVLCEPDYLVSINIIA